MPKKTSKKISKKTSKKMPKKMPKKTIKFLKSIGPAISSGVKVADQKATEKLELVKSIMQYAVEAAGLVLVALAVFFREDLAQIHDSIALYLIIFGVIMTFLRVIGTFLKEVSYLFAPKKARKPASKASKPKNARKPASKASEAKNARKSVPKVSEAKKARKSASKASEAKKVRKSASKVSKPKNTQE